MGQKVKPIGLRLGINRTWDSRWFAEKNYSDLLHKDLNVRKYLMEKLKLTLWLARLLSKDRLKSKSFNLLR